MLLPQQLLGNHPNGPLTALLTALLPALLPPPPCAHIGRAPMPGAQRRLSIRLGAPAWREDAHLPLQRHPWSNGGSRSVSTSEPWAVCLGPWKEAPCPVDSEGRVGGRGACRAAGDTVGKCRGAGFRACVMAACWLSVLIQVLTHTSSGPSHVARRTLPFIRTR